MDSKFELASHGYGVVDTEMDTSNRTTASSGEMKKSLSLIQSLSQFRGVEHHIVGFPG